MTETRSGSVATTEPRAQPGGGGRGGRDRRRRGPIAALAAMLRSIGLFYRQVVAELRKVIWPTRSELITYTIVALVFVSVMVLIVTLLDVLFAKGVLLVFG